MKIITVHGTGAGDDNIYGVRWWQLNSKFQEYFRKSYYGDSVCEFVPFQWGEGLNSEKSRIAAADRLLNDLIELEDLESKYTIIGHSHGGSIIQYALQLASLKGISLHGMQCWCTVGTPFLRINKNIYSWITAKGPSAYIQVTLPVWFLLYSIFTSVSYVSNNPQWNWEGITSQFWPFFASALWACTWTLIYAFGCPGPLTAEQKRRFDQIYGDRWLGIYHKDDEAIHALRISTTISNVKIPTAMASTINLFLSIAVSFVGCLIIIYATTSAAAAPDAAATGAFLNANHVTFTMLGVCIFISDALVKVVGPRIEPLLNGAVASVLKYNIRAQVCGIDIDGSCIASIETTPDGISALSVQLPDHISDLMRSNVNRDISITASKLRDAMTSASAGGAVTLDIEKFYAVISWKELLHTIYFDEECFVEFLTREIMRREEIEGRL